MLLDENHANVRVGTYCISTMRGSTKESRKFARSHHPIVRRMLWHLTHHTVFMLYRALKDLHRHLIHALLGGFGGFTTLILEVERQTYRVFNEIGASLAHNLYR